MFSVGDKIIVTDTGETGEVLEVYGLGCLLVMLDGWPEPCQVHERQLEKAKMTDIIRALFETGDGTLPDEQIIEMVAEAADAYVASERALRVCIQFDFSAREWMVVEYSSDGWAVLYRCITNIDAQHWRAQYLRNPS